MNNMMNSMNIDAYSPSFVRITRIMQQPLFILAWFFAIFLSFMFVDKPLAQFFHGLYNSSFYHTANAITYLGKGEIYLGLFALAFLLSLIFRNYKQLYVVSSYLLITFISATLICDVLKMLCGRARPVQLFNYDLFGFYFLQFKASMLSFPSGHATAITSAMVGLSFVWPKYWRFFLTFLLLVSFSRLVVTAHFLSDVMSGMFLGAMSAIVIHALYQKRGIKLANPTLFAV